MSMVGAFVTDWTTFRRDPHWRDLVLFYEYFHGDSGRGLGASHQTGWTALVTRLLKDCCTCPGNRSFANPC